MDDLISRQAAIDAVRELYILPPKINNDIVYDTAIDQAHDALVNLPSAQPERLTDDDFETIRIHLNAYKENLCNQHRWKEAEEYQRIIDRFMAFASAEPERKKGKWVRDEFGIYCSCCGFYAYRDKFGKPWESNFCPNCGADMR